MRVPNTAARYVMRGARAIVTLSNFYSKYIDTSCALRNWLPTVVERGSIAPQPQLIARHHGIAHPIVFTSPPRLARGQPIPHAFALLWPVVEYLGNVHGEYVRDARRFYWITPRFKL